MNLDLLLWRESFGWLALLVALIILLTMVGQRWLRPGSWRRAAWQITLVSIALLTLAEWSGAVRGLAQWGKARFQAPPVTARVIQTKLPPPYSPTATAHVTILSPAVPLTSELTPETGTYLPSEINPAIPTAIWSLAWIWLAGTLLVLGRYVVLNLFFQIFRWRRAQAVPAELTERVQRLARQLGIRRQVRVQAFAGLAGPVAYGVWRPGIGVPMNYTEQFSTSEQDAMLAHELAHLAAHDPAWAWFTEIVTALLWWHPLVWYARRELRSASEAAADEASALLEHGPQTLAECLVQLGGKLIASPTYGGIGMAGQGLRSGLGQRVERLLALQGKSWCPLNRWRTTTVRVCAVAGMLLMVTLCTAYVSPQSMRASSSMTASLRDSWSDSALAQVLSTLEKATSSKTVYPPVNVSADDSALLAAVTTPTPDKALTATDAAEPSVVRTGEQRVPLVMDTEKMQARLNTIVLPEIEFSGQTLLEVVNRLTELSKVHDPEKRGVHFLINGWNNQQIAEFQSETKITLPRQERLTLRQVLDLLPEGSARKVQYEVQPQLIVFSQTSSAADQNPNPNPNSNANPNPQNNSAAQSASSPKTVTEIMTDPQFRTVVEALEKSEKDQQAAAAALDLRTRTYKVEPNTIRQSLAALETATAAPKEADTIQQLHHFFTAAGLQLTPPKAFFYNTNTGVIFLRATEGDLAIVESVLQLLNLQPPQITLEARYVEMSDTATLEKILQSIGMTRQSPLNQDDAWNTVYGILTQGQYSPLIRTFQQTKGVDFLSAPRVTTLSGRTAQIATVDVVSVVTGLTSVKGPDGVVTNSYQTTTNSFGPVLNVTPYVKSDGYTVQLDIQNTITEFLGYDQPEPAVQKLATNATVPLPRFRQRQMSTEVDVWDGQTVLLAGLGHEEAKPGKKPVQKSYLILLTPTITDPAGNRVHDPANKP